MKVIVTAQIETAINIPDPEAIEDPDMLHEYAESQAYEYFNDFDYIDICDTFICKE